VGRLIDAADVENASIFFEENPRANVSRRVIVTHRVAGWRVRMEHYSVGNLGKKRVVKIAKGQICLVFFALVNNIFSSPCT
jgi:hypothetical protein